MSIQIMIYSQHLFLNRTATKESTATLGSKIKLFVVEKIKDDRNSQRTPHCVDKPQNFNHV